MVYGCGLKITFMAHSTILKFDDCDPYYTGTWAQNDLGNV